ncbi:hypothetical protein BPTFM16_01838 [Altererythrobacter insulae]|nr:hypothetical protein BPTFM16_01838 [Altererythrobacter insulae]
MITVLSMPTDRSKAEVIVDAIVSAGMSVWNETAAPGGKDWSEAVVRAQDTKCLIVCWSAEALSDTPQAKLFREVAFRGCKEGRAIGAQLDDVEPPSGFDCTLYNLAGWRLNPSGWRALLIGDAYMRDLVQAARFKQANRDPAPPSAPRQLLVRQAAVLSSAIIVPLVAVASFTDVLLNFENRIARQASAEEQAVWDALPKGSCTALREFVNDFNDGAYLSRANALLNAREIVETTRWDSRTLEEEIYLPHSRNFTEDDATAEGKRRCDLLLQEVGARKIEVNVRQVRQDCQRVGSENLCDWRGTAICSFEEPREVEEEVCNG